MKKRRASAAEKQKTVFACLELQEISAGALTRHAPRRDEGIAFLAASIAKRGLLSPIVVRKMEGTSQYQLVCGARRLAACRLLGMKTIHAVCIEADAQQAAACVMEEHLTHLPPSAIEEAQALERAGGMGAAKDSALGESAYAGRLALLQLDERTRQIALDAGLSLAQALPLLSIAREDWRQEAAQLIAQRGLSGVQARRLVCGPEKGKASSGLGRRRAIQDAMEEVQRLCERLRAQGIDARLSMLSRQGGLCIQLSFAGKKDASNEEGKPLMQEE